MSQASVPRCPLCDQPATRWLLYPAFGRPICDDCDAALVDDDALFAAACRAFDCSPMLLLQIVEQQRPIVVPAPPSPTRLLDEP